MDHLYGFKHSKFDNDYFIFWIEQKMKKSSKFVWFLSNFITTHTMTCQNIKLIIDTNLDIGETLLFYEKEEISNLVQFLPITKHT